MLRVECLTRDLGVAGSIFTGYGGTALCPCKTLYPLLGTEKLLTGT